MVFLSGGGQQPECELLAGKKGAGGWLDPQAWLPLGGVPSGPQSTKIKFGPGRHSRAELKKISIRSTELSFNKRKGLKNGPHGVYEGFGGVIFFFA